MSPDLKYMEEDDVLRTPKRKVEDPECDEWELVDDDGFLYKRRTRKGVPLLLPSPSLVNSQEPVLSEEAQLRVREALTRRKKMSILLAQKEIYAAELADWEILFKTLEESQACAPVLQSPEPVSSHSMDEAISNEDRQILHLQVEARERFIEQLQSLLAQGEIMCKMLEVDVDTSNEPLERELLQEGLKLTPRTVVHNFQSPAQPMPVAYLAGKSRLGKPIAHDG